MSTYEISYGEGPTEVVIATVDELDEVLDRATAAAAADVLPYIVYIHTEAGMDGDMLGLGVGGEFSYLTFNDQYVPGDLDGGKPSRWYYDNQPTDLPPGIGIPPNVARDAAREFIRTGRQPAGAAWADIPW